jgi:phage terminase small subunit
MAPIRKTLPPPADELTPLQHAFVAAYVANGGNASAAFRTAAPDDVGSSPGVGRVMAHRMLHHPAVARRLADIRAIAAEALNTSVAELAMQAHEIATASVHDIQSVEIYGCRYCWGKENRYQWRSYLEMADAVEHWHATLATKPTPKPDTLGGVGYSSRAGVNPECEECRGHGVPIIRTRATADLSPGAKQLFAGAAVAPDGSVRVMVEDRSKFAHMRNQLIGAYAPTRVEGRHAHLHVHKQAPDDRVPMTAEEAIAALEQFS